MKPTVTRRRPVAASASTIRSAAAAETASGFSHSTGLPAFRQASVNGSCVAAGEATTTASTAGSAISSSPSAWVIGTPSSSATRAALSGSASEIATTSAPETAVASSRACVEPISPAPITPTFTIPRAPAATRGCAPDRRPRWRSRHGRRARDPARRRPSRRSRSRPRPRRSAARSTSPAPSAQNRPRRQAVSVSARSALTPASTSSRTSLTWIASIRSPQSASACSGSPPATSRCPLSSSSGTSVSSRKRSISSTLST